MRIPVMLSICSRQRYDDQEPDTIELVTEGIMEYRHGAWDVSYEESELTGLAGVRTSFRVEPGKVVLKRSGKLQSEMVFEQGAAYDTLYQMEFGTLMMRIRAEQVIFDLTPDGGFVDLSYALEIENTAAGQVDYHLDIRAVG